MPAYRSDAEGLVRTAVVERLRKMRPQARIINEINSGLGNRFDLIAVSPAEIIAVEIKSEKDTLDLLPRQAKAMFDAAHRVIIAHHAKHEIDGYWKAAKWRYPEQPIGNKTDEYHWKWMEPRLAIQESLPPKALDMIWKDELMVICRNYGIAAASRNTCGHLRAAIRWSMTGAQITKAVCAALRSRKCIEADPPALEAA